MMHASVEMIYEFPLRAGVYNSWLKCPAAVESGVSTRERVKRGGVVVEIVYTYVKLAAQTVE
jgi:hypothetical protein